MWGASTQYSEVSQYFTICIHYSIFHYSSSVILSRNICLLPTISISWLQWNAFTQILIRWVYGIINTSFLMSFFTLHTLHHLPLTHHFLINNVNFFIIFAHVHICAGLDHNEQLQKISSLTYDKNTCCRLRYYTLTHLYASNLQQFFLAFHKMMRRRIVQSETLLEALHKPTWVKMMNRSVLNLH